MMSMRCGSTRQMGELAYISDAETTGAGIYQGRLREVSRPLREAVRLFLGRTAKSHAAAVAERAEKFSVSGVFGIEFLGLDARVEAAQSWRLAAVLAYALYPAIYYVVFPSQRYRVPIEPVMAILCVFIITEAASGLRLILQIDLEHVNLLQLGIEHAIDHDPASLKAMHEIGAIQAKDVFRRSTAPGIRRDAQCSTPNRYSKCRPWTST